MSIYYALFHSHLIYCLPIWAVAQQKILNKIYLLQKQAVRSICNLPYNAHTEPSFKKLKILPLKDLIFYSNMQIVQKYKQGFLPTAFNNTWLTNRQRRDNEDLRITLRNQDELYIPPCRLTSLDKFPLFNLPRTWNEFTEETIKIMRNKPEINRSLKKYLLDQLSQFVNCNRLLCPTCHLNQA